MTSYRRIIHPTLSITSPPTLAAAIGSMPPAKADQATAAPAQPHVAMSSFEVNI